MSKEIRTDKPEEMHKRTNYASPADGFRLSAEITDRRMVTRRLSGRVINTGRLNQGAVVKNFPECGFLNSPLRSKFGCSINDGRILKYNTAPVLSGTGAGNGMLGFKFSGYEY